MITDKYLMATAGGALIGTASVMLLWLNGRVAGVSGILNGALSRKWSEAGWRIAFIVGLIAGGLLYQWTTGTPLIERSDFPIWMTVVAGLLVGYGTRLGGGCTSGHGICGVSRLSLRSIVATAIFVLLGMLVATGLAKVMS